MIIFIEKYFSFSGRNFNGDHIRRDEIGHKGFPNAHNHTGISFSELIKGGDLFIIT